MRKDRRKLHSKNHLKLQGPNLRSQKTWSFKRSPLLHPPAIPLSFGRPGGQPRGVVGLRNLGNTCYMNSAIQCISNVPQLTDFFLKDKYKNELNRVSSLGSKGVIAECFADLIKRLWSTGSTENVINPRELKTSICDYAPQFVGHEQHDAHELMMVLLNVLQEDLNKVQQKPYIELKDANGRLDEDVADEVWTRYKKRNDSVVVDLFYGLLKLTVVCPACNYTFRAFDPFASLSLPLDVVLTNALIVCSIGKIQRLRCRIYVPPRCSLEILVEYFNLVRKPGDGCRYVIAAFNKRCVQILEPQRILNFRDEIHKLFAFEVPCVKASTCRQTKCTNGWDADPYETLCDEVLQVINAHLDKEGDKAELKVYQNPYIRVPSRFFELSPTDELQQKLNLHLCFQLFTTKETLSVQSPWFCKKCKEPRPASKKLDFWRLPEVLIIHLKRFRTVLPMEKINKFVDFPVEGLKLRNSRHQEYIYDLAAVNNHVGGLGGGHYTAYAKNQIDKRWYNFDDSYTCPLVAESPVTEAAYVLIYVRRQSSHYTNGDNSEIPSGEQGRWQLQQRHESGPLMSRQWDANCCAII